MSQYTPISPDAQEKLDTLFRAYDEFLQGHISVTDFWREDLFNMLNYFRANADAVGLSSYQKKVIDQLLAEIPPRLYNLQSSPGAEKFEFEANIALHYNNAISLLREINKYRTEKPIEPEAEAQPTELVAPQLQFQKSSPVLNIIRKLNTVMREVNYLKYGMDNITENQNNKGMLKAMSSNYIYIVRRCRDEYESLISDIKNYFSDVWNANISSIHSKFSSQLVDLSDCLHNITRRIDDLSPLIRTIEKQFEVLWEVITLQIVDRRVNLAEPLIPNTSKVKDHHQVITAIDLKNYFEKSHAVIIGISNYEEETSLPNAYNDATAMQKVLQEKYYFDNVISLFNMDATYAKIRKIFVDTLQDESIIGPKDRILVYYAGHGKLRTSVDREGKEIKNGYIIPFDAPKTNPRKPEYSSYIEMETIVDGCRACKARHTLLILDCCYSGYAAMRGVEPNKRKKTTDPYLKEITANIALQVLAAGEEDQPVNDSGVRRGNSAFTGALLDILEAGRDLDDDGVLTASEIGSKLAPAVARQAIGTPQMPVFNNLSGSGMGDFVFRIFNI